MSLNRHSRFPPAPCKTHRLGLIICFAFLSPVRRVACEARSLALRRARLAVLSRDLRAAIRGVANGVPENARAEAPSGEGGLSDFLPLVNPDGYPRGLSTPRNPVRLIQMN